VREYHIYVGNRDVDIARDLIDYALSWERGSAFTEHPDKPNMLFVVTCSESSIEEIHRLLSQFGIEYRSVKSI
jgi:hypothetical protein